MTRWLLALPLLTIGCAGITGPTVALDREFTLAPNEAAMIQATDSVVRFLRVEGDSPEVYELHTGDMKPVTHQNLAIELVQLQPYPFSSRTIEPDDYRATLKVTNH